MSSKKIIYKKRFEKAMEAAVSQNNPVVVCGTLTILARVKEWMKRNDRM